MSPKSKALILSALHRSIGDDLWRAKNTFAGYTESQLDSKFGHSGKTCRQVLAECQERHDLVHQAIREVEEIRTNG